MVRHRATDYGRFVGIEQGSEVATDYLTSIDEVVEGLRSTGPWNMRGAELCGRREHIS